MVLLFYLFTNYLFNYILIIHLTLANMGGGDSPPKLFLTTVLKRFEIESSNYVTFNINLWKEATLEHKRPLTFDSLGFPVFP